VGLHKGLALLALKQVCIAFVPSITTKRVDKQQFSSISLVAPMGTYLTSEILSMNAGIGIYL
jgi:hypothetical protein